MSADAPLLLAVLRAPGSLARLGTADWDCLLRQARANRLLGRLAEETAGSQPSNLDPVAAEVLLAARRRATSYQSRTRFEIDRLARGLGDLPGPRLLLKGGAYLMAGLSPSRGRISTDVDIMVPTGQLAEAERRLQAAGWEPMTVDEYTQRYYRQWMHELPPLRHRRRRTVVDLHHTILPLTHRFRPNHAALIADAVPVPVAGATTWHMLCPADMVVHSAVHLFADGDFTNALREVVDLHDLVTQFARLPGFWDQLGRRAALHRVERPLHYGLAVTERLLGTPVPPALRARGAQIWLVDKPMLALMSAALTPDGFGAPSWRRVLQGWLLYMRSHWLRMPPLMLARHLLTKGWQRAASRLHRQRLDASRAST